VVAQWYSSFAATASLPPVSFPTYHLRQQPLLSLHLLGFQQHRFPVGGD
jgi:hypothetical protein